MTPDLFLLRFGRRYELRGGEELEGEVRRRGFFRPRYEGEIAGSIWHFSKLDARVSSVRDPEGRERASLDLTDRGRRLIVDDEPVAMVLERSPDGSRAWIDAEGRALLRLDGHPAIAGHRKGLAAELQTGDWEWPGPEPAVVEALAKLTLCVIWVAELDKVALEQFNRA
ncbi:MAG: hypothetical protein H0U12_12375 [Thermoleophilaceae bacterium]|nr:hypothetical protein [Thermoleophilaceae bacterium]